MTFTALSMGILKSVDKDLAHCTGITVVVLIMH